THGSKRRYGNLGDRITSVICQSLLRNRIGRRKVKTANGAIVALAYGRLVLITKTNVEGQPSCNSPVVLNKKTPILALLRVRSIVIGRASTGDSQQHGRHALSEGGGG